MIQMKTTMMEMLTLRSSAEVKRPQTPSEILWLFPQGLEKGRSNIVFSISLMEKKVPA